MKVIESVSVESRLGVVRLIVSDGMDRGMLALSSEAARNLIADLQEHVGVAELENDEWKAEREDAEADAKAEARTT